MKWCGARVAPRHLYLTAPLVRERHKVMFSPDEAPDRAGAQRCNERHGSMRVPDALRPLRERSFAWYYAARVASIAATPMVSVAPRAPVVDIAAR